MVRENEIRQGERAVEAPPATDAGLVFIGQIRTPWTSRMVTPRQGRRDGPVCRIEIFQPWVEALANIEEFEELEVLYWLHMSRRDLVLQSPANDGTTRGTFSIRSPARPNPIGTSIARLVGREGNMLLVQGMDCLDGTPLLDLKPERTGFTPIAPSQPGDFEVEQTSSWPRDRS
ncbi:tRNA (N6-threonylcarbamoyladenosine(37)-N6)-methyltransferase TrmO [Aquamicrobium ahrensii]